MRVDSWRFYITPFLDSGAYGAELDVTKDVIFNSIGNLQLAFDNSDYNIGILRNSSLSVTFNNKEGFYSDVDVPESIFRFTRANSKLRITYSFEENPNYAGMMIAGQTWLCTETTVFAGLIDDNATASNVQDHKLPLSVLGYESLLDGAPVPYSSISNGDSTKTTLFNLLNQSVITSYLTVDIANIVPSVNRNIDDKSPYQNQTARAAISDLLLASSSVLYIRNSTVYVAARTAGVTSQKTFYGQAALNGIENIISIDNIRTGFAKVFNYLTWQSDPTIIVSDAASILRYRTKHQEFDIGFFTNSTSIGALLAAVLAEFKDQKQEFVLTTQVDYQTLALNFLDRVTVEYPLMVTPGFTGGTLPICGIAVCGVDFTPKRLSNFYIDPPADFKIMNIEINLQNSTIKFKLRAI